MMHEFDGWLLDLFEHPQGGVVLWFVTDGSQRVRLYQDFPVTFYAAGATSLLKALERFLSAHSAVLGQQYTQRKDLYKTQPVEVLAVRTQPAHISRLVRQVAKRFPALDLYDADIPLPIRYAAQHETFPMAHCHVMHEGERLQELQVLNTPWELSPQEVPLRTLELELDCNPQYAAPRVLFARYEQSEQHIQLRYARSALIRLNSILTRYDPDLVLTVSGDTWLFPHLFKLAEQEHIRLPLNREPNRDVLIKKEGSYFSYGRIIYRGQQVLLYGRCHIDGRNAMLWQDYQLDSALEMARVTRLPIQTAARCSPGTGINMMEIYTALRGGILVPYQKTHGEEIKTAYDLLRSDQGGLVYQPITGIHENVGMIDFVSLYPSIMTYCNISPELPIPKNLGNSPHPPGLIPLTLKPLLEKRVALKQQALSLPHDDPLRAESKARSSSLKMLLVCCFGYLGYKAAKFGRIESHEAISALGREALLRAKEAAEDMSFEVLHMYVDGIWVKKKGCEEQDDFLPLLHEIAERTALPIALDSVYRWVAFLPARADRRMSVPNRYFGVKQDGSLTVRGIEIRKHDSAPYIVRMQKNMLGMLESAANLDELRQRLPEVLQLVLRRYRKLKAGRVALQDLVVRKRMGKELDAYRVPSPAAIAARQLENIGSPAQSGKRVPLVYTLGKPGVCAWHARIPIDPRSVNYAYYCRLLIRAGEAVLHPLGVDEDALQAYLQGKGVVQMSLELGRLSPEILS